MSWNDCVHGGGDRLLYEAMICRQCEAGAASAFRAPLARIRSARRQDALAALARAVAIYLAAIGFGLSATATGRAFGRHRSTVDHACRRVEDRRDADPGFSLAIACLEHALARRVAGVAREGALCAESAPAWDGPTRMPALASPHGAEYGADIADRIAPSARVYTARELAGGAQ
ncbi:helix-turn-helix domain-containing protein [Pseudochelatococcus sp. B33]